jgi:hypothetical protein
MLRIERSQPSLMPDCQIEQDGIGQLAMSHDASANLAANIGKSSTAGCIASRTNPNCVSGQVAHPTHDSPQTTGGPPDGGYGSATPK